MRTPSEGKAHFACAISLGSSPMPSRRLELEKTPAGDPKDGPYRQHDDQVGQPENDLALDFSNTREIRLHVERRMYEC